MSAAAGKGWQGNFFEDFEVGQVIQGPTPRRIGDGEVALYIALTGDRTPRFCGGERWIHPLIVFHAAFGQTVRAISLNAKANLGYASWIWPRWVSRSAVISTRMEIIGLKENSSGKTGIVWVRNRARDEDQSLVLEWVRWAMVEKRDPKTPTPYRENPVVPELPDRVRPEDLHVETKCDLPEHPLTGGRYYFEDYEAGETIFHHDGHHVTEEGHMMFTRLFQNSARVHFDAPEMEGRPLVYGGYVISVGYAQAFNGLENRLGIAAVNAGSHTHPVHSGDTLYSMTRIEEVVELESPWVGALRCRLYVFKNLNPAQVQCEPRDGEGKAHPNLVLDLDFWELMARRPKP